MDKYYALAKQIKEAGKKAAEVDGTAFKIYRLNADLDIRKSDRNPEVLDITNDAGYRSIIIGDIRGNVSYDTGKLDNGLFHNGYAYLYSENCEYSSGGTRRWLCKCYPTITKLWQALKLLAGGEYKYCKNELFEVYLGDNEDFEATKQYLSAVVEKFADRAAELAKKVAV